MPFEEKNMHKRVCECTYFCACFVGQGGYVITGPVPGPVTHISRSVFHSFEEPPHLQACLKASVKMGEMQESEMVRQKSAGRSDGEESLDFFFINGAADVFVDETTRFNHKHPIRNIDGEAQDLLRNDNGQVLCLFDFIQ